MRFCPASRFSEAHAPEAVLHLGGRALSKRLEQFLGGARPDPYVVVRENPFRLDPGHRVTHSVQAGIEGFCEALIRRLAVSRSEGRLTLAPGNSVGCGRRTLLEQARGSTARRNGEP